MSRSRCSLLLVVALLGGIALPAIASHPPRSGLQASQAPRTSSHDAAPQRVIPSPAHHRRLDSRPAPPRPPAVIRYVPPVVRVAAVYRVAVPPRVVPIAPTYLVATGSLPLQVVATGSSAGFPPDWNWRPVESFAALAPRAQLSAEAAQPEFRYYCPDTR